MILDLTHFFLKKCTIRLAKTPEDIKATSQFFFDVFLKGDLYQKMLSKCFPISQC